MKTYLTIGAFTIAGILSLQSLGDSSMVLSQPINCQNANNQLEMNICADLNYKRSDRNLNQVYKLVQESYRENTLMSESLIDAQLAWIKFRDTNCKFESNRYKGGSIAPLIFSSCLERII
jgi:uncharacterized protein YecT (DUF1311 family)